ncbi:MAG: hypothetical protein M3Z84_10035 [Actinomycetota bacterium]|nr:hypothetical protein [Actinomycetota bacterium]
MTANRSGSAPETFRPGGLGTLGGVLRLAEWAVVELGAGAQSVGRWLALRLYALRVAADPATREWIELSDREVASGEAGRRALDSSSIAAMIEEHRQAD